MKKISTGKTKNGFIGTNNQVNKKMVKPFFEVYKTSLTFDEMGYPVFVEAYNKDYFINGKTFLESYGLVFSDYAEYSEMAQKKCGLIEFLKDSVENNYYLADTIKEISFTTNDNHILFELDGKQQDWVNMGVFSIENCNVSCCNSYMFIEDRKTKKQYMYYGD